MTIEDFYIWAKAKGIAHFELVAFRGTNDSGHPIIAEPSLIEDKEERRVIV